MQGHAELPLYLGEEHDAGGNDARPCSIDPELAHELTRGVALHDAQRLGELVRAEMRADEPAGRARAAADCERGLDPRRRDMRERSRCLRLRLRE
jgi:hypothetical protein